MKKHLILLAALAAWAAPSLAMALTSGQKTATSVAMTATQAATESVTPTFTPTPIDTVWRIIANSGSNYTDTSGNTWYPDSHFSGGNGVTSGNTISGTSDGPIYQGERWGNPFTYTFPMVAGTYQVTLKFAETCSCDNGVGKRVFSISINGVTVKTNFDIYATAGNSMNKAVDLVFTNIVPSGGNITINFGPAASDNAKIGGIEIIPQVGTNTPTRTPTPVNTATIAGTATFSSTTTPSPIPTWTPVPTAGTGLCGDYRNEATPFAMGSAPVQQSLDSQISFNWGTTLPSAPVSTDNFDVHWTGYLESPYSGFYSLSVTSASGVSLTVGSNALIVNWTSHTVNTNVASIYLTANAQTPLDLKYYNDTGAAVIALYWSCATCPGMTTPLVVPQGRLYPCSGGVPPPTFTPTLTLTPLPPVYQGLSPTSRLLGLEYIPFPVTSTSSNSFYDLSVAFAAPASNQIPKNTARWRIELVGLSATAGAFNNDTIAVETRIGPYGVTCTTGYWNPLNYIGATTLSLPDRPQNLSTTYVWLNSASVPPTEQYDTVGDPRYVPYLDMMSITGMPFKDNYNWFFKNLNDSTLADYESQYYPFVTMANNSDYSSTNMDVPKQMRLWREGILKTASIFSAINGWSNYYVGSGGEIGGDSSNKLSGGGVPADNGPWNGTGSSGHDEILGSAILVRNTSGWMSMPFIGELWPDASYNGDWSSTGSSATWGNLRNAKQTGGLAYRDSWNNFDVSGQQTYNNVQHRVSDSGCKTFMNGNSTAGNSNTFNHSGRDGTTANWFYDSQVMALDYNFAVPNTFTVARPWGLDYDTNLPQAWSNPPYSTSRTLLNVYSASTQSASTTGFFDWTANGGGTNATQRSSAAVRSYWGGNVGWYVINGLAPSTDAGFNFVARFALISCLRTFHDAGAPAATTDGVFNGGTSPTTTKNRVTDPVSGVARSYRIEPIPWIHIDAPTVGQSLAGVQSVPLQWTRRYVRWDGQRYTENYPCIDDVSGGPPCPGAFDPTNPGNPNLEWHSLTGTALAFNVIYSMDSGTTWKSAMTNATATAGVYMGGVDSIPSTSAYTYNYLWNVAPLPAGSKKLRVECFRLGTPLHYGYHELTLKTAP